MKLTLRDHARIVLGFALAFAATMSFHRSVRLREADWWGALCTDGMVFSIVLTMFTYASVRPGPRRVALMEAGILAAAVGFLMGLVWDGAKVVPRHLRAGGVIGLDARDWQVIVMTLGVALFASPLIVRLGRRAPGLFARDRSAG